MGGFSYGITDFVPYPPTSGFIGWLGLKTSSNTGAYNDWDSMIYMNLESYNFRNCKFTSSAPSSLGRPMIFTMP